MTTPLRRRARRLRSPSSWKVGTRRVFALTAPVSIPLWGVALLILGFAILFQEACEPLARFWSAPPMRLPHNGYDSYTSRSERSQVVKLESERERRDAA